jgi:hypothetical protein
VDHVPELTRQGCERHMIAAQATREVDHVPELTSQGCEQHMIAAAQAGRQVGRDVTTGR